MINIQSTMLLNLPEDAWRTIALHLSPPDILSFLSVHRNINNHLAKNSASFWHQLTALHLSDDDDGGATTSTSCATNSVPDAKNMNSCYNPTNRIYHLFKMDTTQD